MCNPCLPKCVTYVSLLNSCLSPILVGGACSIGDWPGRDRTAKCLPHFDNYFKKRTGTCGASPRQRLQHPDPLTRPIPRPGPQILCIIFPTRQPGTDPATWRPIDETLDHQ
jgi:hypothetical protein